MLTLLYKIGTKIRNLRKIEKLLREYLTALETARPAPPFYEDAFVGR